MPPCPYWQTPMFSEVSGKRHENLKKNIKHITKLETITYTSVQGELYSNATDNILKRKSRFEKVHRICAEFTKNGAWNFHFLAQTSDNPRYIAALSNAGNSNLSDVINDAKFCIF